ncbi:hypothetical protein SAPIO_CDS1905 [Scedosporium apiospermum]|uniref:Uncharacterized protein n=1 Tax=Pseudallescheria apiosperma TaxID=563466 RepID=A0A084GE07_PSEDA|nr:uncharacterized protein SAPIO_CDS1905 [Scedosporium apiospermum]KEZ45569.1 hypothetical protein SAPIO_CDS1905 [Scedosporium apiospermum]
MFIYICDNKHTTPRLFTRYPVSVWGLWFAVPLLAVACISEIALKLAAPRESMLDDYISESWVRFGPQEEIEPKMELWPSSITQQELVFQVVAAGIALFEAVMLAFFVARVVWRKPFNMPFKGRIALLIAMALSELLALTSMIFIFVLNHKSARFDEAYAFQEASRADKTFVYDKGTFTTEMWACSVKRMHTFDARFRGLPSQACRYEMAAKWLTVAIAALLLLVFELVFRDRVDGRGLFAVPRFGASARPGGAAPDGLNAAPATAIRSTEDDVVRLEPLSDTLLDSN